MVFSRHGTAGRAGSAVAVALLAAGCSAASPHRPAATASADAAVPATQPSSAPWVDPAQNLLAEDGFKLIARSGKQTLNGYQGTLAAHRDGGTVDTAIECQGVGKLTVTMGATSFTFACTKSPSGETNEDATGLFSAATDVYSVTAPSGVVWAVAVAWAP
ncbi:MULTISPECIES: hypothetical protein [Streptacidiphilus]|uniref:Lipoprotein n=1 Tax=Streptacidiphilus cavernicola TaxID=3342716 RepID=A0ABV6V109_9ACTN|nr:hypothetical protein [Streptacidiphilus jeojiense]